MANAPELLAVIPFYQRKDQLNRCLAALAASTVPVTPFVHDNTTQNIGFTKALNLGLKAAHEKRANWCLLLNQDCYVRPDTVANLIRFMESHPRCAIGGPKQLKYQDPDFILHGGCLQAFPIGENIGGYKSKGDCAVSLPMPWVNGAILFVRMTAVFEFGIMDENMLLIGSDSDWCYTARSRGWEVWYCAEAECLHEEGASAAKPNDQLIAIMKQDMAYWRDKWIGPNLYARLCNIH